MAECMHLNHIHKVTPQTNGCEECLKMGDTWVHLRLCLECGHVGCCDSSKNKHATKHFHKTTHPIMKSIEPGDVGAAAALGDEPLHERSVPRSVRCLSGSCLPGPH